MVLHSHRLSIGLAVLLAGSVIAIGVPAVAVQTTFGVTVTVEPEAPYFGEPADYTILVEVSGGSASDVTVQAEHDCSHVSERVEVSGNGDDILAPGEQWRYTCHTDFVFHGIIGVSVTGTDGVGSPVSFYANFDYGAPFPFEVEITASADEVGEGDQVIWEILVGNLGTYAILDMEGMARLNRSGSYSSMAGPVEVSGNGDDLLDPGEVWAYQYTVTLWQDSFASVSISGAPEHAPGTGFGSTYDSETVIVTPCGPTLGRDNLVVYDPAGRVGAGWLTADGVCVSPIGAVMPGAEVVWSGDLGGAFGSDVLFYDRDTGGFQFVELNEDATGLSVMRYTTGTGGWSSVVPGDFNGDAQADLLFYRASDGLMRFYTVTVTGRFAPMTDAMYGTRNWTHLVPGDFDGDGRDDVLWYRASDGLMRFYSVSDTGGFFPISDAMLGTRNWTHIPSGDYDGDGTDDLLYYRQDGLARFYTVRSDGVFVAISPVLAASQGWDQIVTGRFDPVAGEDLAWYRLDGRLVTTGFRGGSLYGITWSQTITAGQIIASFAKPSP